MIVKVVKKPIENVIFIICMLQKKIADSQKIHLEFRLYSDCTDFDMKTFIDVMIYLFFKRNSGVTKNTFKMEFKMDM